MTEADLADLGIHRIPVPIPFVTAGGPINVYVVEEEGGGILLWDAGLGSPEAQAALEEGFRRLGRRFAEVTRILLSHGHVDHYGAARFVQERHGGALPVLAHPDDAGKIDERGWRWEERGRHYEAFLGRLGVPAEVRERSTRTGAKTFTHARRVEGLLPLVPGTRVRTRHLDLEVLHMPGHTPGLCVLHEARHRLLLAGDHLLEKVSPNPLIELGPDGEEGFFRPLVTYLESVARTRALDLDLVLPGHGPPFSGHRAVIDGLVGFYERRMEKVRGLLAEAPRTAWEVCTILFPRAHATDPFLTISETIANLEVLEARGAARRALVDGVYRFQ